MQMVSCSASETLGKSTNADLHVLLETRVNYHVIALQKTKSRKTNLKQLSDDILIILGEKVPSRNVRGRIYPSVVYLVDLHEILSTRLAILRLPLYRKPSLSFTVILQHKS
ncbi:unnamed protein product [Strongylus vulgaris]|uniref:Uncharacterized protein n=1 Tax=Strongylus vulgaris TaxID=40348 RepID=A0A3P7J6Y7_STRVU|nr:unnamed protein product [Strongylus vulgaris]